jgi:hypothetical protein
VSEEYSNNEFSFILVIDDSHNDIICLSPRITKDDQNEQLEQCAQTIVTDSLGFQESDLTYSLDFQGSDSICPLDCPESDFLKDDTNNGLDKYLTQAAESLLLLHPENM